MLWRFGWISFLKRLRRSREWVVGINIVLVLALLLFIGRYLCLDLQKILHAEMTLRISYLWLALMIYGLNFLIFIIAWQRIVVRFGGPTDLKRNVFLYSYTNLARFLPTPIWFIASRVHNYNRLGVSQRSALIMTAMETLLHALAGLVFYSLLSINLEYPVTWLYMLVLIPAAVVLCRPRWLKLPEMINEVPMRRQDVVILLTLYVLTWIIAGLFLFAIINIFIINTLSLDDLWRIWTLASLVSYVATYMLGGIGVLQEFTLTWLLGRFYSPGIALLIAVGARLTLILGGILYGLTVSGLVVILSRLNRKI